MPKPPRTRPSSEYAHMQWGARESDDAFIRSFRGSLTRGQPRESHHACHKELCITRE
ncbi:hypothetical protein GY45DRAFT_844125 [Cubamyces sp. BRFM 1775]|nr:hypothetical protein GY45DRAFT_844125 [Cubamyces sp. BRFM 1775]